MKNSKLLVVLIIVIILLLAWLHFSKDEENNISNNSQEEQYSGDETQILLYFLDSEKVKLVEEYRYVSMESIKENMLKTILEELIKGPTATDLIAVIPTSTKINSIIQEGNKVIVDFSKEFNDGSGDSNEELQKIYSVVNSLTEVKEIEEVEIRVDGEVLTSKNRL